MRGIMLESLNPWYYNMEVTDELRECVYDIFWFPFIKSSYIDVLYTLLNNYK